MPSGLSGRLAGALMLRTNRLEQREVLALLRIQPGDIVLEVGYGPGGLLRLLTEHTAAGTLIGVDPSPEMRAAAGRRNPAADVRLGTAAETGLDDGSVDHVVTVNTVAIWPDLAAGLRELRRVVRPGGTVTIAWHGGSAPGALARRLRLPADKRAAIDSGLRGLFSTVERHTLTRLDAFRAVLQGVRNT